MQVILRISVEKKNQTFPLTQYKHMINLNYLDKKLKDISFRIKDTAMGFGGELKNIIKDSSKYKIDSKRTKIHEILKMNY